MRARTLGVPVWVHENDVPLTRHPRQYARERALSRYLATQVRALPIAASLPPQPGVAGRRPSRRSAASRDGDAAGAGRARWSCTRRGTRSGTARCTCRTATR